MLERFNDIFKSQKDELICHLRDSGISEATLEAMSEIPRHEFVTPLLRGKAYLDQVIKIPKLDRKNPWNIWRETSTLSQPTVIAQMIDALALEKTDLVLEIGTGTGYQTALLGKLAAHVVTVDIEPDLCIQAQKRLQKLNINNVTVIIADGSIPFTPKNLFDKIIVTASVPPIPLYHPILDLLKPGGLAVLPLGGDSGQPRLCQMITVRSKDEGYKIEYQNPGYSFVPLEGILGWSNFMANITNTLHVHTIIQLGGDTIIGTPENPEE